MVQKARFKLARMYGHYALNVAGLPFRLFGTRDRKYCTQETPDVATCGNES